MQFELGAPVLTSDGQDAGRIDKLILDAKRLVASAIVMRQGGLLLGQDSAVYACTILKS